METRATETRSPLTPRDARANAARDATRDGGDDADAMGRRRGEDDDDDDDDDDGEEGARDGDGGGEHAAGERADAREARGRATGRWGDES